MPRPANQEINVHVVDYRRACLYMRYRDPITGKHVARSTGTSSHKEAVRVAAKWEAELQEGRYKSPSKVTWIEFRHRYEDEVLPSLADKTAAKVDAAFNAVEQITKVQKLASLTSDVISQLQSKLRSKRQLSESTIKSHMAHLKSALNWAVRVGLLIEAPAIDMPKRANSSKVMKGRPITTEEFERMLAAVPKVVASDFARRRTKLILQLAREQAQRTPTDSHKQELRDCNQRICELVESWRHYLRGLWWSGLRLEESLELYWDRDDRLCIDLSGRFPMLRIPAELEKGNKDRLLPIAPEFAEFLFATTEHKRTGRVFNPLPIRPERTSQLVPARIGKIVSNIGATAGVKVHTNQHGKVKSASAHDLRKSFGARWAPRVMPQTLKELMRHESIETTLRYYVGRNAESTAQALWSAVGKSVNDRQQQAAGETDSSTLQSPGREFLRTHDALQQQPH